MNYNKTGGGLWVPTNRGVVFSPMMSSFGGGSIRGFNGGGSGGGAALPVITQLSDILSNIHSAINGSQITHNGYGFMLYSGVKGGSSNQYSATMDVSSIDTIRFVLMGGGGAGNQTNIHSGQSSGGVEGLLDVSGQTSITLEVGTGGEASSATNPKGTGGTSRIKFGSTNIVQVFGGLQAGVNNYDATNYRPSSTYNTTYVTPISAADGAIGGGSRLQQYREPFVWLSPTLSGAYAHGACSGQHGTDLSNDTALGYGGGGGGTHGSTSPSPGGPLGYAGGLGTSGNGQAAQGPSVSSGTSYGLNSINLQNYTHPRGGGGGGAFGGAGLEVYDIGQGATGLVKIWWAANDGDASKLSTVGNLYN